MDTKQKGTETKPGQKVKVMIGDFHREDSWFQADSTGNALDWPVRGCFVVELAVVSFGAADVKIAAAKTAAAVLAVVGVPAGPDKVVEGSQTSHT